VNKISLVIGLIISVGVMLVIPSPIGHVAKASTCSTSLSSSSGGVGSGSFTTSGSCSSSGSTSQSSLALGQVGGQKSSCTSGSTSKNSADLGVQSSNGAVSCSSHSP
jgi:hypothetical protein